jgi:hypothetical protein
MGIASAVCRGLDFEGQGFSIGGNVSDLMT